MRYKNDGSNKTFALLLVAAVALNGLMCYALAVHVGGW